MNGECARGKHKRCPDTKEDTGACSCPCHLHGIEAQKALEMERLMRQQGQPTLFAT